MAGTRSHRKAPEATKHRESTDRYRRQLFLQAWALVERDYRQPLTLPMVARLLCSSPRQIQRAYEQFAGASFSTHLRVARLAAAAELLRTQPLAVRDVARLVGYQQSGQFSRAFTRRYGLHPSAYRAATQTGPNLNGEREKSSMEGNACTARQPAQSRGASRL